MSTDQKSLSPEVLSLIWRMNVDSQTSMIWLPISRDELRRICTRIVHNAEPPEAVALAAKILDSIKEPPLISLDDWNKKRTAEVEDRERRRAEGKSGIACPKCGDELIEDRSVILDSFPQQLRVGCPKCHYSGYKVR